MEASVVVLPMKKTSCSTISRRFERYVNMENNTSERTRASEQELAEYMGEQIINNLCNSHPILSFGAPSSGAPTTPPTDAPTTPAPTDGGATTTPPTDTPTTHDPSTHGCTHRCIRTNIIS